MHQRQSFHEQNPKQKKNVNLTIVDGPLVIFFPLTTLFYFEYELKNLPLHTYTLSDICFVSQHNPKNYVAGCLKFWHQRS